MSDADARRRQWSTLTDIDACPDCGGDVHRDFLRDPPGTVRCEGCEGKFRLPDTRQTETKARDELWAGILLSTLGLFGLWVLTGQGGPNVDLGRTLFATGMVVSAILVFVGYLRFVAGVEYYAELSVFGEYGIDTRHGSVTIADLLSIGVAFLPPGIAVWLYSPLGPIESYVRGAMMVATLWVVVYVFDASTGDSPYRDVEYDATGTDGGSE